MISKTKLENFKEKFEVVSCFIECRSEILLLHRQDSKPRGNTWGMPAGKVDAGEDLKSALVREIKEEIGLDIETEKLAYFEKFFVRYPEYDFIYHVFHVQFDKKPTLKLNFTEHKNSVWKTPQEALKLNLIPDEDFCIMDFYKI